MKYEENIALLAEFENIINSRPISYMSEQEHDKHISPVMFLKDTHEWFTRH